MSITFPLISSNYETKEEFYADLIKELKEIEIDSKLKEYNAGTVASNWSVLVIMLTTLLAGAFMIRPLIARFSNIN